MKSRRSHDLSSFDKKEKRERGLSLEYCLRMLSEALAESSPTVAGIVHASDHHLYHRRRRHGCRHIDTNTYTSAVATTADINTTAAADAATTTATTTTEEQRRPPAHHPPTLTGPGPTS